MPFGSYGSGIWIYIKIESTENVSTCVRLAQTEPTKNDLQWNCRLMSSMVSLITMFRDLELIVWEWPQWRCVVVSIWSFHIDSDSTIRGKETLVAGNWILVFLHMIAA